MKLYLKRRVTSIYLKCLHVTYQMLLEFRPHLAIAIIKTFTKTVPAYKSNPFKLHFIDPSSITYAGCGHLGRLYGIVAGGDWDKSLKQFENSCGAYEGVQEYILNDNPEPLRRLFDEHIRNKGSAWNHDDLNEFDDRLSEIDDLFESIRKHGYLSQRNLHTRNYESITPTNNEAVPDVLNEVTIAIGREGEFIYAGFGSHRLSIAKILNVDKIPVIIGLRHILSESDDEDVY